ncbi:DNA polymerase III subunit beta [candidate division WWE3 bacterium CG08_land_8_20_14_0_20_43_13]|uniref:Beta sliding clamp n=1 Tax=candidate division WWE3 bacterium CG08_land_8_20_14_0_20_43_13 TaxID=1975087 RepID=A0A2H0X8F3_UNCKA|nr:MAG: DNA polymerase III subunit beta [candidate division WWE3 bacterium CG08_land_8_20_14_0_20_43_13]
MNFSCRVEHFGKALSQVGKAVCSKGALPVLSNILVLAEAEGRVVLSSTDLETSIKSILPAKVEQAGAITIPYRILSDLFGNLTFEVLSFSSQEQKIDLTGEGFSSRILGLSADEFPQLSDLPGKPLFCFPGASFSACLERVLFATSADSSRPVLGGVLFYGGAGQDFTLVGADGFRLAEQRLIGYGADLEEFSAIIPAKALREVVRLGRFANGSEAISFFHLPDTNQVAFEAGGVVIMARVLNGEFPDYKKIMPSSFTASLIVKREDLLSGVRCAMVFAQDLANVVKLHLSVDGSVVKSESQDVGEGTVSLPSTFEGEELTLALNGKYLFDCLNIMYCPSVFLGANGSLNPVLLRDAAKEDDSAFSYVIMPVRFQE